MLLMKDHPDKLSHKKSPNFRDQTSIHCVVEQMIHIIAASKCKASNSYLKAWSHILSTTPQSGTIPSFKAGIPVEKHI